MSDQNDPRLGYRDAEGKNHYPRLNVLGDEYRIAESITQGIGRDSDGRRCFVIVPVGQDCADAIAEVKALLAPPAQTETPAEAPAQETVKHDRKARKGSAEPADGTSGSAEPPAGDASA